MIEVKDGIIFAVPPPKPIGSFSFSRDFYVRFNVPYYPCWFYRIMQRAFLGIYWRKLPAGD